MSGTAGIILAQAAIKRLLADAREGHFYDQLDREGDAMADTLAGAEAATGLGARLNRATPGFGRRRPSPWGWTGKETDQ